MNCSKVEWQHLVKIFSFHFKRWQATSTGKVLFSIGQRSIIWKTDSISYSRGLGLSAKDIPFKIICYILADKDIPYQYICYMQKKHIICFLVTYLSYLGPVFVNIWLYFWKSKDIDKPQPIFTFPAGLLTILKLYLGSTSVTNILISLHRKKVV